MNACCLTEHVALVWSQDPSYIGVSEAIVNTRLVDGILRCPGNKILGFRRVGRPPAAKSRTRVKPNRA